jgi:hypothetical protein
VEEVATRHVKELTWLHIDNDSVLLHPFSPAGPFSGTCECLVRVDADPNIVELRQTGQNDLKTADERKEDARHTWTHTSHSTTVACVTSKRTRPCAATVATVKKFDALENLIQAKEETIFEVELLHHTRRSSPSWLLSHNFGEFLTPGFKMAFQGEAHTAEELEHGRVVKLDDAKRITFFQRSRLSYEMAMF